MQNIERTRHFLILSLSLSLALTLFPSFFLPITIHNTRHSIHTSKRILQQPTTTTTTTRPRTKHTTKLYSNDFESYNFTTIIIIIINFNNNNNNNNNYNYNYN